jgi:drug/metabolite transporter (DMT)-like permease
MINIIQVIQLIGFTFIMSMGQLLFKKTALTISENTTNTAGLIEGGSRAIQTPWLYLALTTYALATVLWLYILQRIPLTIAYPFSALAMILVPLLSIYFFSEKLTLSYFLGAFLIILGITIIAK